MKLPLLDFDLEPLPELGPEVDHFLQELAGSSEEDDGNRSSPEPLVEEYERWVSTGTRYAWLVARASQDFWHGQPPGASPEGIGLL